MIYEKNITEIKWRSACRSRKKQDLTRQRLLLLQNRSVRLAEEGTQVGIVIGGGNFWRGRTSETIDRNKADQIGMLATVMNCIYVSDICSISGTEDGNLYTICMWRIHKALLKRCSRRGICRRQDSFLCRRNRPSVFLNRYSYSSACC